MDGDSTQRDIEVDASHRVLIDVLTVLGAYIDQMVVVGGWVPELTYPKGGHIGSLDVDLALDGRRIKPSAYNTIRERLLKAGYNEKTPGGNIFERLIKSTGQSITVKLDLITGEKDGPATEISSEHIHGINVAKMRGTDLALDHSIELEVSGELPEGGIKRVKARIAAIPAFVCMKAIAMNDRKKEKDAYDIWFCLRQFKGGPEHLAKALADIRGCPLVEEAIESLRRHFESVDSVGPVWAGQMAAEHGEDEAQATRDAYERAQQMLKLLSPVVQ